MYKKIKTNISHILSDVVDIHMRKLYTKVGGKFSIDLITVSIF